MKDLIKPIGNYSNLNGQLAIEVQEQTKNLRECVKALIDLMKGVEGLPPLTAIQGALAVEWINSSFVLEEITGQKWEEVRDED